MIRPEERVKMTHETTLIIATWIVVYLMTSTGGCLCNQFAFVSGKVVRAAFTEEGRKHEDNMGVGFDVSVKRE
jgi:hypothetical protein